MPNQNGRTTRDENHNRPSWRQQDMDDDRNDRMMRGGNESRSGSRREWDDDRDDGYRTTDRYGGGQSGYGAGRFGDDRSMGPGYRNQRQGNRDFDDRQGMHTDDRFTGRGGSQYWDERGERGHEMRNRDDRFERTGYNSGYNQGQMGYGGYGQGGNSQNMGGQSGFRGGSGGAQFADDYNRGRGMMHDRDVDQGMGYGQGMGHQGQRQGGMQGQDGYYGQGGVGGGYGGGGNFGGNFGGNVHGNTGYGGSGMQGGYGSQGGYRQGMQGNYGGGMQGMQGGYGQEVRGGHRGKGPTGYTRSDDRIKEQICEALADDDHIDATHIEVVVKNGEVILTGTVDDRRTKRLAEDLVERMPGVKDVQNQLRVGRGNLESGRVVGKNETETSSSDKKHRA